MSEPICPFGDGRHKLKVWQEVAKGRAGFSCALCHKTWEFPDQGARSAIPTWDLLLNYPPRR